MSLESAYKLMGLFDTWHYTLVHGFCYIKLFPLVKVFTFEGASLKMHWQLTLVLVYSSAVFTHLHVCTNTHTQTHTHTRARAHTHTPGVVLGCCSRSCADVRRGAGIQCPPGHQLPCLPVEEELAECPGTVHQEHYGTSPSALLRTLTVYVPLCLPI